MARRVLRLEARAAIVLAELAARLAPLAQLAADLAHQVQVLIRLLAVRRLLTHGRVDLVHVERQFYLLVDV